MNMESYAPQQARSARLLILGVAVVLVGGAVGTYFLLRPKKVAAIPLTVPVQKLVEASCLSEDQKKRITADVTRLTTETQEGRVSDEQSRTIRDRLFDGPFMDLLQVEVVRARAAKLFEADAKRKQRNMLALDRFERGIRERKFSQEQMDKVMAKVARKNDKNHREITGTVTDGQTKAFITAAGLQAEQAQIPAKSYQADLAAAFHSAIAGVLWQGTATGPGDDSGLAASQPEGPLTPPLEAGPPRTSVPKASKAPAKPSKRTASPSPGGGRRPSRQSTPQPR
jgi:hypothetical protein